MKSEHRHELKTNDLAKSLLTFQDYVKVYGGRVALGLAIVILAIVLLVQRSGKAKAKELEMQNELAYAQGQISRLSHLNARPGEITQIREKLKYIREEASNKAVQAAAAVAQGDYAWAMANYPNLPAAATEPSWRPEKERPEMLKEAKDAYQQVLDQYSDQQIPVLSAHFGLAAVAENQANWDEAKRHYEAVNSLADVPQQFKALAENNLKRLEEIRKPVLIGVVPDKFEPFVPPVPPTPATTPTSSTTKSTASQPATKTATPTTKPATPTTKPSTPTTKPSTSKADK